MHKHTDTAEQLRLTAYFLWENDGRPEGGSFSYWLRAKDMLVRQLAYDRWLAEGTPADRDVDHWHDAVRQVEPK